MKRAHCVFDRACSWLAVRAGAWIIGLAVVWMTAVPIPAWGQGAWFNYPNNGAIYVPSSGNVGIGTTPTEKLSVLGNINLLTNGHFAFPGGNAWTYHTSLFGGATYVDDLHSIGNNWLRTGEATGSAVTNNLGTAEILMETGNVANNGNYAYISFNTGGSRGGTPASRMFISDGGNVGIGTTNPQYLLSVKGTVGAEEFIVTNTGWSDYVFRPGYRLRPWSEVNAYIQANHHLPDIPSEAEVKGKGVSVGEMQSKLLAKVEELTLHMIQQERENQELRERIARLERGAAGATPTAAK